MASSYDRRSNSSASRPRGGTAGGRRAAAPDPVDERPQARRRGADPRKASYYRRKRVLILSIVSLMVALIVYVVVVFSPLFEIKSIVASPTAHVNGETISALAAVPGGSTLFNMDEQGIEERLVANPWIESVRLSRKLPDQLVIDVKERTAAAVVMLSNGTEAWLLATDGCWIEPVAIQEGAPESAVASPSDQAYAMAQSMGLVYVSDVSALLKPGAGTACQDDAVNGVVTYLDNFTSELSDQIVAARASSREAISVILSNGIEVSLGAPVDIAAKEQVVLSLMAQYPGQITYINVRVPTTPSWRGLDAAVTGGTPATGDPVPIIGGSAATAQTQGSDGDGDGGDEPQARASDGTGTDEGGPNGHLDEGGYYSDSGTWVYAYHAEDGTWINGYYDEDGEWVKIS